jgi:hypothetical protein
VISISWIHAIPVHFSSDGGMPHLALLNLRLVPSSSVPRVQNIKLSILENVILLPSFKGCETPTHFGPLDDAIFNLWTHPPFHL